MQVETKQPHICIKSNLFISWLLGKTPVFGRFSFLPPFLCLINLPLSYRLSVIVCNRRVISWAGHWFRFYLLRPLPWLTNAVSPHPASAALLPSQVSISARNTEQSVARQSTTRKKGKRNNVFWCLPCCRFLNLAKMHRGLQVRQIICKALWGLNAGDCL